MERVLAKLTVWKGLYEELGRVQAQLVAALEAHDSERVECLKNEAARLAMRSDAALQELHEAVKQRERAPAAHR
jgi:hypothetical protein